MNKLKTETKLQLIMLKGLPASGKSTYAEELINSNGNFIRVNKDLISKMLYFGKFTPKNRTDVISLEESIAELYLTEGKSVIVDDTNLRQSDEDKWRNISIKHGAEFSIVEMKTDWVECIERDSNRVDKVGEYVIKNFALEIGQVDGEFVICDLDGTLCDISDRLHLVKPDGGEKNWKAFFENIPSDKLREDIAEMVKLLYNDGKKIVYLSGRPEEYKKETIEWLKENGMDFNFSLIMRRVADRRDDVIVKREMLNKYFKDRSKIFKVIDDRPKVVALWKEELGEDRVIDVGNCIDF
ncbi:MAG TPA: AAA family ATPase [Candidatus Pelethenecus sp.]|nr:AAA family ATPase [Candidatus Pelethenecus sp.]